MSQHRKSTYRKSSSTASSSSSSENNLWQNIEQTSRRTSQSSSSGSSTKRPIYPNVPKRTQRSSSIIENDLIQTESQIDIIPSEIPTQKSDESSSNQNAYNRHISNLLIKYTSPQKLSQSNHHSSQPVYRSTCKRTLSPLDETNQQIHESKRTKSFDDDDNDDDELSQLLDHRYNKQILSQSITNNEQTKPTVRKPTFRKLSTNQQKPIKSQTLPIEQPLNELLIIEPDIDTEEEHIIDQYETKNTDDQIKSPIKLSNDLFKQNLPCTPIKIHSPLTNLLKKPLENSLNHSSPCSNIEQRRFSSTSSLFDTPQSSLTTTSNIYLTPQTKLQTDNQTQILFPSKIDMLNKLILEMNLNENKIIYNPIEFSRKLFHQSSSLTLHNSDDKHPIMNLLLTKQLLNIGRYQIEISFPINNDKMSKIYVCDICLKHFYGSILASQRHASKCLYTQPPGKLVFNENNLSIFEIGQTKMNIEQRIYIQSLCRIARLFIDSNNSINDTKLDHFVYYILCQKDPILSQFQSSCYRFIGYFSKKLNQNTQKLIHNLSCLFILPCFNQHKEYNQLLIAYSYFLIRSNTSMYSTPHRPLDNITRSAFRIYWRDIIFTCINNYDYSLIKIIPIDTLACQTSIHPRDILSSLYSYGFIVLHQMDKSSIYILNNAYHLMNSLKLNVKNKLLYMNMELIDKNKQNNNKRYDSDIEEIILD